MAYFINPLPVKPKTDKIYILDTNIWCYLVFPSFTKRLSVEKQQYVDFVTSMGKACLKSPLIKLTSYIKGEVLNRYLRDIKMNMYATRKNELDEMRKDRFKYYKEKYKNSEEFEMDYRNACDDIMAFKTYFELIDDEFSTLVDKNKMDLVVYGKMDFNDYLIYKIAATKGYTIITNDSDFLAEDVEILTLNSTLLKASGN